MTNFFTFIQNNSGGYNIINNVVAKNLIIEAENAKKAIKKMRDITTNEYRNFCACCGERWNEWIDDEDGTNSPMVYNVNVFEERPSNLFDQATIIYYLNGEVKKLWYDKE
ncbi:hypothetical protein P9D57_01115 [Bacillus sonorensis]|uniref:DUF7296 family protein n=1 Tax=Bacillus sonorensis TaxID=119858 RepID=UPI002DBCF394|nr:hypothetical protein [Bacillus sonorensis]MEC1437371.1 hypothetical protein [Bacillus sonorensis]